MKINNDDSWQFNISLQVPWNSSILFPTSHYVHHTKLLFIVLSPNCKELESISLQLTKWSTRDSWQGGKTQCFVIISNIVSFRNIMEKEQMNVNVVEPEGGKPVRFIQLPAIIYMVLRKMSCNFLNHEFFNLISLKE